MNTKANSGFTLIELMVVLAVIGILSALLLPVLARGKEKGCQTQCLNNFKQLGIAFQLYADDHADQLPGPVWQGFYENYDDQVTTRLTYYVATYLSLPAPGPVPRSAFVARCPSAAKKWANIDTTADPMTLECPLSYIASAAITNFGADVVSRPFGYPGAFSASNLQNAFEAPKRLAEIGNPASSWALTDADQGNAVPLAGYYPFLPRNPSHGNIRNELFFDWHAAAVAK